MPILKRILAEKESIKDYRNTKGVHYEAKCDFCGSIFYPKRSTAKYCSKICGREAVRIAKSDKKSIKYSAEDIKSAIDALEVLKDGEKNPLKLLDINKQIKALKIAGKYSNS